MESDINGTLKAHLRSRRFLRWIIMHII